MVSKEPHILFVGKTVFMISSVNIGHIILGFQ